MAAIISAPLEERLREESIAWITTVRSDGTPQPAPVWFLWQDGGFLIYSQPSARKIRNIAGNPIVAINLNSDDQGGKIAVFVGKASVDLEAARANEIPEFLEKYREGIRQIDMTPESMAAEYSAAIRVTPTWIRDE